MRVFVTGATGFIGRALIPRLQRDGHDVVAWVRVPARARGLLGAEVELVHADTAPAGLVTAIERSDAAVNLAAGGPGRPAGDRRSTPATRVSVALTRLEELAKVRGSMLIPSRLTRRLRFSALAMVALTVMAEEVVFAQCEPGLRAPTAEEQTFYAGAFAQFQKIAPPAPAGWTATDEPSTGVRKEVCAAPGKPYLLASFSRTYNRGAEEVRRRQVEAEGKALALAKENQAAMKAGTLNFEAYQAAMGKITAEGERDNVARFRFIMGGNDPTPVGSGGGFSPVTVPVGKGYRQVSLDGEMPVTLMIVVNPATPARSGLTVMFFEGDPARVDAMLKAASFQ